MLQQVRYFTTLGSGLPGNTFWHNEILHICILPVLFSFSCQTYEGGFSAVPGTEAHGGYTFCGFAASLLLNKISLCNVQGLLVRTV